MIIDHSQISQFDTRYRAQLINSLSGFKSANLIGTLSGDNQSNLAIVSSVFHIGANPPLVGTVFRPHSVPRHTLENILETKSYTINQVSEDIYRQAHQTSARFQRDDSEFSATGLTEEFVEGVPAPFVQESQLKYALSLQEHQILSINKTELIIGVIEKIIVNDSLVKPDGYIDIEAISTMAISGLDSYHKTQRLARLSYAKPDQSVKDLNLDGTNFDGSDVDGTNIDGSAPNTPD